MNVQCDGCHKSIPEADATLENVPGATLAWCSDCTKPTKAEMYL